MNKATLSSHGWVTIIRISTYPTPESTGQNTRHEFIIQRNPLGYIHWLGSIGFRHLGMPKYKSYSGRNHSLVTSSKKQVFWKQPDVMGIIIRSRCVSPDLPVWSPDNISSPFRKGRAFCFPKPIDVINLNADKSGVTISIISRIISTSRGRANEWAVVCTPAMGGSNPRSNWESHPAFGGSVQRHKWDQLLVGTAFMHPA